MAQSRSTSTTKAYLRVIKKFLEWCKSRKLSVELPFSVSTVSLYLFEIHQSCASSATMIQAHAALKWFHSFVPSLDSNPLDSEFCKNIIESAKRTKSKPVTKKPFSSQIIKAILDSHNKEDASLKNLRVAEYIRIFVPRSKTDVYREGNCLYQIIGNSILPHWCFKKVYEFSRD